MKKNLISFVLYIILFFSSFNNAIGQSTIPSLKEGIERNVKGNEFHSYTLPLTKGDFVQLHLRQKKVNLQVIVSIPEKDTLKGFLSNFRAHDGLEMVEFTVEKSDTYTIKVSPYISRWLKEDKRQNFIDNIDGGYTVEKFKVLSPKGHKALLASRKAKKDSVIYWLDEKSLSLNGVKAETGFSDLSYLKPILKDARIVGMGETSHGTREVFQMKHRMLEFLVKEMGFTLFGIEASHVGCKPINDYVLYGKGNSRDALSAQGFWVWNVESVIDMIEWMYRYNKTVPEAKKVKFIGVDTQTVGLDLAYQNISKYLKKTGLHPLLEQPVDSVFQHIKTISDRSDLSKQRQELHALLSYIYLNELSLTTKSSPEDYKSVLEDLKKIIQGVQAVDGKLQDKVDYNIRDDYMAQTVLEILHEEGPDAKMMLWAHNGHIHKDSYAYTNGAQKALGSVLKEYLGDKKYYAIGFATYQGTFQARSYVIEEEEYVYGKVGSFKIFPAREGDLDWYFAQTDKDLFFIDFKEDNKPNAIHSFLNKYQHLHTAGATWAYGREYSPFSEIIPDKYFDGMIFIKKTSSAVLTPGGEKEIERRIKNGK
ncbi:erythromycin esterase family protein [Aquimarina spongiae]|uniref:Erythromycin esterase n=1 Tax=Aquimarina spongiae TaxID=570521 RepID=A0A1M6JLP2_9FLAO|nr:erythromycin esterase family protein [Aquimarina spongiae]SHJ47544.1 erythromycin esterase [Aquimarina spongiae]